MRPFFALVAAAAMLMGVVRGQDTATASPQAKTLSVLEQLVQEARSLFDLGRYGAAEEKCRQVLAFNHHNKEALHGLELIQQARAEIAGRPADENHSAGFVVYPQIVWELPSDPGSSPAEKAGLAALKAKLSTILPGVEFHSTPLCEVVTQLSEASHRYDPDGKESGLVIEVRYPEQLPAINEPEMKIPGQPSTASATPPTKGGSAGNPVADDLLGLPLGAEVAAAPPPTSANTPVTFHATNVSLLEALRAIGKSVQMQVKVDPDKVSLVPLGTVADGPLITIAIRIPASFIGDPSNDVPGSNTDNDEVNARKFLDSSGVTFPPSAKAVYLKRTSQLIVRNTQPNIDLVQSLVAPGY